MGDEGLVKLAQKGNDEAFYRLIADNKDKLYNIAYCYLKNEHDALEAIQETTCRAYIKINKLKEPRYFNTWLTKILINYCIDEQKRKRKIVSIEEERITDDSENNLDSMDLGLAVEKLEPKYKQVIVLKYFQDMTVSNIALVMDCPEGTVKTWISRGLNQLRELLNKGGEKNV